MSLEGSIRVGIKEDEEGRLFLEPKDKKIQGFLLSQVDGTLIDLPLFFGKEREELLQSLKVPEKYWSRINHLNLSRLIPAEKFIEYVEERITTRERRAESIAKMESFLSSELRIDTRSYNNLPDDLKKLYGIIAPVDRIIKFWCTLIALAKADFLRHHYDQDKESNDDYLGARSLIFDDCYAIYFDEPGKEDDPGSKYITLREIIDVLVYLCGGRELDSFAGKATIEGLRSEIAKLSGDPKLISLYPQKEEHEIQASLSNEEDLDLGITFDCLINLEEDEALNDLSFNDY